MLTTGHHGWRTSLKSKSLGDEPQAREWSLPPVAPRKKNPGVGRQMRRDPKDRVAVSDSRNLALAAVFGALYAALVVAFAPISNLPIQVRVADALMPLAILFGWPVIIELGIGALAGNFLADSITGFPSASIGLDMVGGSLVNLLAGFLAWKIGQQGWRIGNRDRKSTRLNSSHLVISYAVFCLKKKKKKAERHEISHPLISQS